MTGLLWQSALHAIVPSCLVGVGLGAHVCLGVYTVYGGGGGGGGAGGGGGSKSKFPSA